MSAPFSKTNKAQVWSCGGGTQSCAIAALIVQGKLPKPDFSVIADTGYETGATWEFMDRVLVPELAKVGVELVRVSSKEWCNRKHGNTVFHIKDDGEIVYRIPLFSTRETPTKDKPNKLENLCTSEWKTECVERYFSHTHHITRSKMRQWIGFSYDECRRTLGKMMSEKHSKGQIWWPLIEAVPMNRWTAKSLVESMGWGTPPRSACWMCPNHGPEEWRKIKAERPDEFQKAVELEREIHKVDPDAWLHRSCIPLDQVDFNQPEDLFSRPCDSGQCFV